MDTPTFVTKFHNIEGLTLAEKQKNLNTLFKTIPPNHDDLLTTLVPQNHLENLFKLKLLLKLQRIPELLQNLKHEEEYLPVKLLKNRWFCQHLAAILDENSTGFVDGVLPYLSFVIRKRLITKLAVFGTKLDLVFDEVNEHYGINFGANLLVGCSSQKIESVLKEHKVVLTPLQVKTLYRKHPKLFAVYAKKNGFGDIEESFFKYVAKTNIQDFLELVNESNNIGGSLGKRLTRRIVTQFKEFVINNANKCRHFLHLKTLIKSLKHEDLRDFVMNYCPPSLIINRYGLNVDLSNLQPILGRKYYKFLEEIIEKKYNTSIYDVPDLINEKVMETMDVEERLKWIEIKKKNKTPEDDLIPFLKVSDAIPLIKNKINVTSSIGDRDTFIQLLVRTCKVNNDLDALEKVGQYVCTRHRNDDENTLKNFLLTLTNLFRLEKLEERHWKIIDTLLNIAASQDSYFLYDFYIKKVEFLFSRNKLTDGDVCKFLKLVKSTRRWSYQVESKQLQKILLIKSVKLMPKLIEADEKLEYADLRLLDDIFRWNQENPKDCISVIEQPRLLKSLKKAMKEAVDSDEYVQQLNILTSMFKTLICTKERSELRDEAIKSYFAMSFRNYNLEVDFWLLKYQPEVILVFFDKFLDHLYYGACADIPILTFIKMFTAADFQQKVTKRCLELIDKRQNIDVVFSALAVLAPPNDFLGHISHFYPSFSKFDDMMDSDNSGSIAVAIAKSFKYTSSPLVLPTLITYCKGDFLGHSLESLYHLFRHLPGNQVSTFMEQLSTKAVSVRKHSIFLTCMVGTVADVQNFLRKFIKNERNVSVQKHLFTATLKYFVKNPSEEFWEFVKVSMLNLDRNDRESFELLLNVGQVPEKYQARHVLFVWDILKKGEDIEENQSRLLSHVPSEVFQDLPLDFILGVISENFLKTDYSIDSFVVSCLGKSPYRTEIIGAIFDAIKVDFSDLEENKLQAKTVFSFIDTVVRGLERDLENLETVRLVSEKWHSIVSPTQAFREHLKLSFAVFYLESEKDMLRFSKRVTDFLKIAVSIYDSIIVSIFAEEAKNSLQNILGCYDDFEEDFFKFCLNILKSSDGLIYRLFVLKLLPLEQPSEVTSKELFFEIVKVLKEVPDESIRMLMNLYVMEME